MHGMDGLERIRAELCFLFLCLLVALWTRRTGPAFILEFLLRRNTNMHGLWAGNVVNSSALASSAVKERKCFFSM